MSDNKRIFYACQAVSINQIGDTQVTAGSMVHGAQSIGLTTTFNLEQAFELSQIEIYENIEGTPDVEVTMEKVLDGYPLIYHLATTGVTIGGAPITGFGLAGRSAQQCDLRLGLYSAANNNVAVSGDNNGQSEVEVYCSGMFISSVSYSTPVDGSATESVTMVGNNKRWLAGADTRIQAADVLAFDGTDSPLALGVGGVGQSGGVQQREDVLLKCSILPVSILGYRGSGVGVTQSYGNAWDTANDTPLVHIQSFSCSTDFSREDILELGRKTPYFRPANFPIEVTTEIESITVSGDFVAAYEFGDPRYYATISSGNNTADEQIFICMRAGYGFDCGNKNKLSSVTYGGGDAGGGNVSVTYSFSNFNQLDVQDWANQGYLGAGAVLLSAGTGVNGFANDAGFGAFPTSDFRT